MNMITDEMGIKERPGVFQEVPYWVLNGVILLLFHVRIWEVPTDRE